MKAVWASLAMLALATACNAQTQLPKDMPPNAEITYVSGGGFKPTFFQIVVSGNSMKVKDQASGMDGKPVMWDAKLTEDEVKALYRAFVENQFDLIRPNKEVVVPDGKFRSIELKFDQKRFYAVMGDGIKVAKGHDERFHNVENVLGSFIKKYRK